MPSSASLGTAQAELDKFVADSRPLNQAAERARLQERVQRNKQALVIFKPEDTGYKNTASEIESDEAALAKLARTAPSAATEIKGLQEAQARYERHVETRKDGAQQAAARGKERRDKRWLYIQALRKQRIDVSNELQELDESHIEAHARRQADQERHEAAVHALFAERIATIQSGPADAVPDKAAPAEAAAAPVIVPSPAEAAAAASAADTARKLQQLEELVAQMQAERAAATAVETEFNRIHDAAAVDKLPVLNDLAPEDLHSYAKMWDILQLWHQQGANSPFTLGELIQCAGLDANAGLQIELLLGNTKGWWEQLLPTTLLPRQAAIYMMHSLDKLRVQLTEVERQGTAAADAVAAIHAGAKRRRGN